MALTVNEPPRQSERNIMARQAAQRVVEVQCDNSYPTGGYDFNARQYCTFEPEIVWSPQYGGYVAEYDAATDKLLVTKGGSQVSNGSDLTGVYFYVIMMKLPNFSGHSLAPTGLL